MEVGMARYIVRGQRVSRGEQNRARELRRRMTPAEGVLWDELRGNRFLGLQFRRQQVIGGYIADFYCHRLGLIIEVDGPVHDNQNDYDRLRDDFIQKHGLRVVRFRNHEILSDLPAVMRQLESLVDATPRIACGGERTS